MPTDKSNIVKSLRKNGQREFISGNETFMMVLKLCIFILRLTTSAKKAVTLTIVHKILVQEDYFCTRTS